jgi:hypothetical protein
MSSLELLVKSKTQSGAVHLEIKSSGDDLGILYLSADQFNTMVQILRTGCFNKEVDFVIDDPYNSEEDEDNLEPLHSFFPID